MLHQLQHLACRHHRPLAITSAFDLLAGSKIAYSKTQRAICSHCIHSLGTKRHFPLKYGQTCFSKYLSPPCLKIKPLGWILCRVRKELKATLKSMGFSTWMHPGICVRSSNSKPIVCLSSLTYKEAHDDIMLFMQKKYDYPGLDSTKVEFL